ncbi:MAG: hypothetical protein ABWX94_03315 [Candidatus Saccharimonadales bacterium]
MGRNINNARSGLQGRRKFQASFGARHPIVTPDKKVSAFFNALDEAWADLLPERDEAERRERNLSISRFTLYDGLVDERRLGITVLERRVSLRYSRQRRLAWTPQDVGRIRGEIEDELDRQGIAQYQTIPLTLSGVSVVGDAYTRGTAKFALIPEAADQTADLLAREHEIVVNGLRGTMRNLVDAYDEYLPHLTVGKLHRGALRPELQECANALTGLLAASPLVVDLAPLTFTTEQ